MFCKPRNSKFAGQMPSLTMQESYHTETSQINIPFQIFGGVFIRPAALAWDFLGRVHHENPYPGAKRARMVAIAVSTKSTLDFRKLGVEKIQHEAHPKSVTTWEWWLENGDLRICVGKTLETPASSLNASQKLREMGTGRDRSHHLYQRISPSEIKTLRIFLEYFIWLMAHSPLPWFWSRHNTSPSLSTQQSQKLPICQFATKYSTELDQNHQNQPATFFGKSWNPWKSQVLPRTLSRPSAKSNVRPKCSDGATAAGSSVPQWEVHAKSANTLTQTPSSMSPFAVTMTAFKKKNFLVLWLQDLEAYDQSPL